MNKRIRKETIKNILFKEEIHDHKIKLLDHFYTQLNLVKKDSQEENDINEIIKGLFKIDKFMMESGINKIENNFDYDNAKVGDTIPLLKMIKSEEESVDTGTYRSPTVGSYQEDVDIQPVRTLELKVIQYEVVDAETINKEWQEKE